MTYHSGMVGRQYKIQIYSDIQIIQMLFNLSYICLAMNFVFYTQTFLGRRSCYFMEGMGGMDVVWIHMQRTVKLSHRLSVLFCLVYVACMLESIYEYRQNMASESYVLFGGKNLTRGTFAAQYVQLFYPFIYERTVPISVGRLMNMDHWCNYDRQRMWKCREKTCQFVEVSYFSSDLILRIVHCCCKGIYSNPNKIG